MSETFLWIGFNVCILALLALDLSVFNRKAHEIKVREALLWTAFWIVLSLLFNLGIWHYRGSDDALLFFTSYLVEKSLSMDNIFVFLLIFTYFGVSPLYQHKVLFWGIIGALIMRAIFIFAGVALIVKFHWIIYIFGAFLVFTGIKMITEKDKQIHPEKNPILKLFRKFLPVTDRFQNGKFFIKKDRRLWATPLFIVLVVIETTDVVFAVDSIPAVLAITHDPFIVYTSNVMAILGLRALYFALAGIMGIFRYLHYGLAVILAFVGVKMLLTDLYKIPTIAALGVIGAILLISVVASLVFPAPKIDTR